MDTMTIGNSEMIGSRLAYGCWRIAGSEDLPQNREQGRQAVLAAIESGYTLFDLADIYGGGRCEEIFGEALKSVPGIREKLLIATKCGIRFPGDPNPDSPHRYDFSKDHILNSCEGSLKRMGVETIDLYMLHRPDYLCDPEEVASAFSRLKEQGKVRKFGVSNFTPWQFAALQKFCPMPLACHQFEISLGHLEVFHDGTLEQCMIERVTPLAWSPLGGGRLLSRMESEGKAVQELLEELAKKYSTTPAVIAVAWLKNHPSKILPIIGTTNPERIRELTRAAEIDLSREEWYRLMVAALGRRLP